MKALAIFGSTARNERDYSSDIDMIGIHDAAFIRSISHESVSLFLYPESILNKKMLSGDLFALHLVKESIPIYGEDILQNIYSKFKYKDSYMEEINTSIKIAFAILDRYDSIKNHKEANKKIAWCLRTFLISVSAQDRNPVFSKKLLSEYIILNSADSKTILSLINTKSMKNKLPEKIINIFHLLFNELSFKFKGDKTHVNEMLVNEILNGIESSEKKFGY